MADSSGSGALSLLHDAWVGNLDLKRGSQNQENAPLPPKPCGQAALCVVEVQSYPVITVKRLEYVPKTGTELEIFSVCGACEAWRTVQHSDAGSAS